MKTITKWILNKCNPENSGAIISGYQESFWSNQTTLNQAKTDYQNYHGLASWDEIDVQETDEEITSMVCQKCGRVMATGPSSEKMGEGECCGMPGIRA